MLKRSLYAVAMLATATGSVLADPGYYAGVEYLLLSPQITNRGFDNIFYVGAAASVETDGVIDDGLESGVRLTVGKEACDGFGVQFRYFHFESDFDYSGEWDGGTPILINGLVDIEANAIDIEMTQRAQFRAWDLVVSGGLRYGSVEIAQPGGLFNGIPALVFNGRSGVEFEGVGPTFSITAQRPIGNRGLSVVGRARTALLFGDIDQTYAFQGPPFAGTINDDFVQVSEFQLGLQADRHIGNRTVNLGIFWEAQRWDSDSNALGDLGLHGLSLMAGLGY